MPGDHPDDSVRDCVEDVMDQGHDESSDYAICHASINGKTDDLERRFAEAGAEEWVPTVTRMIENGTDRAIVQDVTDNVLKGRDLAKSDSIEKVGFDANVHSALTVFKADDDFIIWGPASVEVVDKEGDKIHAKALSKALPQLLKRARLSLDHSDQLVGRILENFETGQPVEVKIDGRTFKRSEFPTDVLELDGMEPALYVAGEIFNDTRQAQDARKSIESGDLTSYSISGEALVTRKKVENDGTVYNNIVDLDLSAVTLCEDGMNQKAGFGIVAEDGEKTAAAKANAAAGGGDDPVTPGASGGRVPSEQAVASVAKTAVNESMSTNNQGGDSAGGVDIDTLQAAFKSILDSKLPDGELATKQDSLNREEIKSIAEEVYETKQEDDAGEQDMQDSGQSDDRPGDGADPKLENPEPNEDMQDSGHSEDEASARPGEEADLEGNEAKAHDGHPEGCRCEECQAKPEGEKAPDDDEEEDKPPKPEDEGESPAPEGDGGGGDKPPAPEDEAPAPEEPPSPDEPAAPAEEPPAPDEPAAPAEEPPAPEEAPAPEEPPSPDEPPAPEEEEPPAPEAEAEPAPGEGGGGGLTEEELEEMLPADVWEVVREYIGGGAGGDPAGEMVEASEADAQPEPMEAAKSDDIEAAVENVLSGKGIMQADGADTPAGEVEKSYSDEEPSEAAPQNGDHPALANFY